MKNNGHDGSLDVTLSSTSVSKLSKDASDEYKKEVARRAEGFGISNLVFSSDIRKDRQYAFWYGTLETDISSEICDFNFGKWHVIVNAGPESTIESCDSDKEISSVAEAEDNGIFSDADVDDVSYMWGYVSPFYVTFYLDNDPNVLYMTEEIDAWHDLSTLDRVFDFDWMSEVKQEIDSEYGNENMTEGRRPRKRRKTKGATLIKDAGNVEYSVARFNRIMTTNAENTETAGSDSVSLGEDTMKQGNAWVNKGKAGTHGKFATKKAADDQRKAMFANGYKEDLNDGPKEVSSVSPYTCGYITKDGTLLQCDEYHGEDKVLAAKGYVEYSNTHFEEDTCVRIYEKPTSAQYEQLERIIDLYLEQEGYCKVEVWKNKNEYVYYKAFSLYEGACQYPDCDEIVGNWTGYKLVRTIKEFFDSVNEDYPEPKKLYSIKDKKATWDDDAQDFIWWDSESKHHDKYATSYKVKMSPKEFLDLTTSKGADNLKLGDYLGFGKLKELDVDELNKEKRQPCFLIISFEESLERKAPDFSKKRFEADVVGHEGRHRMFALMNEGVEEIDVQLKIVGGHYDKYSPYEINELTLTGQFNKNVKVTLKNPVAMSWAKHRAVNPRLTSPVVNEKAEHSIDNSPKPPYGKREEGEAGNTITTKKLELPPSLGESIERHDTLNPKLWDVEMRELRPEVKDKIDGIVKEFCSGLDDNEVKYKLDDVKLVGSNCSFNYTGKSDLDVHIVFDLSIYDDKEKEQMAEIIYNYARSLWGKNHDIDFYGIPVEVFVETNNTVDLNADQDGLEESFDVGCNDEDDLGTLLREKSFPNSWDYDRKSKCVPSFIDAVDGDLTCLPEFDETTGAFIFQFITSEQTKLSHSEMLGKLTSIAIPSGIDEIPDNAFNGYGNLTSVTIPSTVSELLYSSFGGCESLSSIAFPEKVPLLNIHDNAFRSCGSLKSIALPDGVNHIGYGAFQLCRSLTSVTIPESVGLGGVEFDAFYGCISLRIIRCDNRGVATELKINYPDVEVVCKGKEIKIERDERRGAYRIYTESGYDGHSMSNNARSAYDNDEKPLSKWSKEDIISAAKQLDDDKAFYLNRVPLEELRFRLLKRSSWHHTSSHYNKTDFYSFDEKAFDEFKPEDRVEWMYHHKAVKDDRAAEKAKRSSRKGRIDYLVWGGTRNHPKAYEEYLDNVNIEERGSFYIVTDDEGRELLRKKRGSNGTRVRYY